LYCTFSKHAPLFLLSQAGKECLELHKALDPMSPEPAWALKRLNTLFPRAGYAKKAAWSMLAEGKPEDVANVLEKENPDVPFVAFLLGLAGVLGAPNIDHTIEGLLRKGESSI